MNELLANFVVHLLVHVVTYFLFYNHRLLRYQVISSLWFCLFTVLFLYY